MKCEILHESRGRMRVHLCVRRMTLGQADITEYYLRSLAGVSPVQVFDRTRDAVIVYTGDRPAPGVGGVLLSKGGGAGSGAEPHRKGAEPGI